MFKETDGVRADADQFNDGALRVNGGEDLIATLDAVRLTLDEAEGLSTIVRLKLARELAGIRADLGQNPGTIARLKLAKRLAEIRRTLGAGAIKPAAADPVPVPDPAPIPDTENSDPTNFGLQSGGIKTRERLNAQVRGIVAKVQAEGLTAAQLTPEDRAALAQYSGRGGLTDNSQSEYYTPLHIAGGTWDLLAANGFANGNVLEPSTGAGVFSSTKPAGMLISGAEIDPTSSAVAQLLHPEDRITNTSFEKYALHTADDSFDAVTGNVPFGVRGKEGHHDAAFKNEKRMERYFVRRVLDKVRPGGLVTLIVPTSVIGKKDGAWAKWRADVSMHAEFLGGHKLPSKTFGRQGTDVVTDIIVLRKHPRDLLEKIDRMPVETLRAANVLWPEFIDGRYWQGEGLKFIHGTFVPGDPNAARSEDKVIAPPDMTDADMRRRLAVHFDSRIDWAMLDAAPAPIRAYAEGDRKVINGLQMEMRAGAWVAFVPTATEDTVLDPAVFGVDSLAALEGLLTTSDGMLSLTAMQAFRAWKRYPHLFNGAQSQAVEFAMSQPADKFRDVAYRGSLLGSLVSKYAMGDDATDRERVIGLLQAELVKYGHPSTINGMVLDGVKAQAFGSYLGAIDSAGNLSAAVRGDMAKAKGFEADNVLSIVTYLGRQSSEAIDIPGIAALYAGPRNLNDLGDIADVTGIAITAQGDVTTTGAYCCGDVYSKVSDLQNAQAAGTDERLKAHWTRLIDLMLSLVKHSDITEIGFGLRDNWIAASYKLEFLRLNGYPDIAYVQDKADAFSSGDEGEQVEGRSGGVWSYRGKDEFRKQLCHYLAGNSIGHNLRDRADATATERKDKYQEQVMGMEEQFKFFMQSHRDGADLASTYDMTFNRHVTPDYDQSDLGLKGVSAGVMMHGYQNAGVRRLSDEGSGILGYDVGLGKAQPLNACILTPDGWSTMGDMQVGSTVLASDGAQCKVIGVFPQGKKKVARLIMEDGGSTVCCYEHLWTVRSHRAGVEQCTLPGDQTSALLVLESDGVSTLTLADLYSAWQAGITELEIPVFGEKPFATRGRKIKAIEVIAEEVECKCIAIDHPSHLYVTDDYIVTHNTFTSLAFSVYDRQMGRSKKHCTVVPKSVLANWYMESKKMLGTHTGVLFVGFEPKRDKKGNIVTEPVLDENNQPKANPHTGEIEYQDVLIEDSPAEVFAKMHSIPAMADGLVIMTQEKFKIIPLKPETVAAYGDKWVDRSMTSAANAARLAGKDEKDGSYAKKKQEAALENHFYEEGTAKKGELPFFEDMGFDRVIVDEGHHYKASFQVKEGMDKLAYLPNPMESQRAQDMALKLSQVRDANGGKGAIMLTATPVANSPIEIYNMLMHIIPPEEMDKIGVYTPADFVRFFGKIESVQKLTVSGEIEPRDGLKGFRNLNILRGLFNRYANMMGARDVDPDGNVLKLPEAVEVKSQAEMTVEQKDAYVLLRAEAKLAGSPAAVASGQARPMFAVLRDMDRVTTDVDLFHKTMTFLFKAAEAPGVKAMIADLPPTVAREEADEDTGEKVKKPVLKAADFTISGDTITYVAPDVFEFAVTSRLKKFGIGYVSHPLTPKYTELVKNLKLELAIKGKQLIFTEEKSQHGKLERLLVESLPEDEARIGIINADTASGEKLQEIVDAYTRGDFTIVICNKKAEVGVNLQRGTTAVHHMTLPWTPASIQQRNGRAVRQGNKVSSVRIYYYQAKGSFDEYRLDLLAKKASWITALLSKDNTEDEHDNENAASDLEQAALLSDNREEFLAKLAEQQAKKDAEAKERRDSAAKIGLGQLTAAREFVSTFEARKAKAIAEAQADADRAVRSLETAKGMEASPDKANIILRRAANLKRLQDKVKRTGAEMDAKLSDTQSRMRQVAGTLRAQASRGELPFNATLIDTPEEAIVTLSRLVVYKGGIFEVTSASGKDIFRVLAIDRAAGRVSIEYLATAISGWGKPKDGEKDVETLFGNHGREVHFNDADIQAMKLLKEPIPYHDLAARVTKDVLLANAAHVKFTRYALCRNASGELENCYGTPAIGQTVVYPDRSDKALLKEVAGIYGDFLSGKESAREFMHGQSDILPALFGEDWQTAISEYILTATPEQIRTQAMVILRMTVPAVLTTAAECAAAENSLRALADHYNGNSPAKIEVKAWAAKAGYFNRGEITDGLEQAARVELAAVINRHRELDQQEKQKAFAEAQAASASDPRFKELTSDQAMRFAKLGIRAQFNNGDTITGWQPFSGLFLFDTKGVGGLLKRVKDMMKPRFGARWNGGKSVGFGTPYSDTWGVPARTDVDSLLIFLED